MKMAGLVLLTTLVLVSSFAIAEVVRFSGSNENTRINEFEILPYDPPEFATNITLRANITDDVDKVIYCNFTLISPTGVKYIDNVNGTEFGEYWNSTTKFDINETGTWTYVVQSHDNDSINLTPTNSTQTFTITDNYYKTPTEIKATIPINYNLSYNMSVWTDTREYLNFSVIDTLDDNLTVEMNITSILVNSSQYSTFVLNISSNSSSLTGPHNGSIVFIRRPPFERNFTLLINISISTNYGDVEYQSPSDYTFVSCGGSISHSLIVQNNGNYPMTDCVAEMYSAGGAVVSTADTFTLAAGGTATAIATYDYSGSSTDELHMAVECTASPDGGKDRTSTDPKITFSPGTNCGTQSIGGGGGGIGYRAAPREIAPEELEEIKEAVLECGDGVCSEDETPLTCSEDCVPDLLNLEKLFCTPIFECGNWKTSWFINFIIFMTMGVMVFLGVRGGQIGRLR